MVHHDSENGNKDTVHFGIAAFSQKLTFNDLLPGVGLFCELHE